MTNVFGKEKLSDFPGTIFLRLTILAGAQIPTDLFLTKLTTFSIKLGQLEQRPIFNYKHNTRTE